MRTGRAVLLAAAVIVAASSPARAESVVVRLHGPGADAIEEAVGRVFESHGYQVVDGHKKATLRVSGRVREPSGKKVSVRLTVRRASGAVVGRLHVRAASGRSAVSRVEKQLWSLLVLADDAPRDGPPQRIEVHAEADDAEEAEAEEPAPKLVAAHGLRTRRRVASREPFAEESEDSIQVQVGAELPERSEGPWITIAAGPELFARHFSYRDDIFQALREYDLDATPAFGLAAEAYPMAVRPRGLVSRLGVAGRFTMIPTIDSEDASGGRYTSEARSYQLGGRYRQRIAFVDLTGALDYGAQSFSIAAVGDAPDPEFPDVSYGYLRAGLGLGARVGERFGVSAAAGYRQVLSTGEIESADFFPRASARGFDVQFELCATLRWGFDVRAGAELERYGYTLNPEPGDENVAGGAVDQYTRAFVRLGYSR